MKKSSAAFLLALIVMMSLFVGCGPAEETEKSPPETIYNDKRLTLVYICSSLAFRWCQGIADSIESYAEDNNFELMRADTGRVNEKFVQLVEDYCAQEVDGFFLAGPEEISERIYEIIDPTGIPYLGESVAQWNWDFTELLTPGIELNSTQCQISCGRWLGENFREYFKLGDDVDLGKIGFIPITYIHQASSVMRPDSAMSGLKEVVPEFRDENLFLADCVKQGALTADAAYREVSAILYGNPQIEYWLISAILDDLGQGAASAVESAEREANVLIASVGGEVLVKKWDEGYDGCWKMCSFFQAMDYSSMLVPAMMQLIREGASYEDLWPEHRVEGQEYSSVKIEGRITTKETYGDLYRWEKGDPHP